MSEHMDTITLPENRLMVISNDIDGFVSASFLSACLGWQLVGVYTMNALYLTDGIVDEKPSTQEALEEALSEKEVTFVDHDINHPNILSIGHHILKWSNATPAGRHILETSINPNLLRGITCKQFERKYPFATIHLLLSGLPHPPINIKRRFLTLLLHIDSSLKNAFNYQSNALDWLEWLGAHREDSPLYPFCHLLRVYNPVVCLKELDALADDFKRIGVKPKSQAQIENPNKEVNTIKSVFDYIETLTGWRCEVPTGFDTVIRFRRLSCKTSKKNFVEKVLPVKPFSYAIISRTGFGEGGINYNFLEDG